MRYKLLPLVCTAALIVSSHAAAQPITLRAAKAPASPAAWDEPAQASYTRNANGTESYAIDSALRIKTPNLPGTTAQGLIGFWVAKNTLIEKVQDKHGLDLSFGAQFNTADDKDGAFLQLTLTGERDQAKDTKGSTLLLSADFQSFERLNLGGCGRSNSKRCTFWNAQLALYSNQALNPSKSIDGRSTGTQLVVKVTSRPFPAEHGLHRLTFSVSGQLQNDFDASGTRKKEHRSLYKAKASWRFHTEEDTVKPSLSIERATGSDILQGLEKQAFTKVAFGLQF